MRVRNTHTHTQTFCSGMWQQKGRQRTHFSVEQKFFYYNYALLTVALNVNVQILTFRRVSVSIVPGFSLSLSLASILAAANARLFQSCALLLLLPQHAERFKNFCHLFECCFKNLICFTSPILPAKCVHTNVSICECLRFVFSKQSWREKKDFVKFFHKLHPHFAHISGVTGLFSRKSLPFYEMFTIL